MTKANEPAKLPAEIEPLLENWPVPERDEAFWEQSATAIEARLAGARAEAPEHQALLEAPLPKADEDGSLEDRPSRSLVELARMSLEQEKTDEQDAAEIARESLSVARRSPVPSEPVPSERAPASQPVPSQPAPSQPMPAPVAELSRARARKTERSIMGPMAMTMISVLGLAAAAIIVVRAQREAAPPVAVATVAAPSAASAPATADQPSVKDDIFSIDELGPGKAGGEPRPSAEKMATSPKAAAGEAKQAPPAATAPPEAPKTEAKPDKDENAKLKPALTAGDIPDKPSTGAVQAAIGQVLGGARACVAGQSEPSKASVTFGSDGRVQSVSVSGPAAGTNAEACIRSALSKARVQPFARPTFSVGATVRP